MPDINFLSIAELAPRIARGDITSEALTEHCLNAIARDNGRLNAFITVVADRALAAAHAADREIAGGRHLGPLHGIPISLKDLIDLEGVPTTAASRLREGHLAAQDAPATARLRQAGAIPVGKCNLHEFAFGTTSEDSAFGPVRNPLDLSRSPGGSSGGSAAGIVAGMSIASVGTDTGGSIRIPSAVCGIVGLKPTFGEIPCDGVVPLSWSLDHVGPIARSVADSWLLYRVMRDDQDARLPGEVDQRALEGLRLGMPRAFFFDVLDSEVAARFEEAVQRLVDAGAHVHDVDIPHAADAATVYLHIQLPEASAYHATAIETRPEAYTPPVRLRLEMGRYVTAEDYVRAERGRAVLREEVDRALSTCDALILPTVPIPAPAIGQTQVAIGAAEWPVRTMMLRLTQVFNVTRHPAITLPCGLTRKGLPCGFQMVGRRNATEDLLAVALGCEREVSG
jgi:aspartyl-tRNA(Asn)/glutamyl-tRNA(Gln) amidotransferase subunit A